MATTIKSDGLAEYHFDPDEAPPAGLTIRCMTCGTWFATQQKLSVHLVVHQRRRCRHCACPYSANAVSHHEKYCADRVINSSTDECEGWQSLPNLTLMSSGWVDDMCSFLQQSDHLPDKPGFVLVVGGDHNPVWLRTAAVGAYLSSVPSDRPVCVVPAGLIWGGA